MEPSLPLQSEMDPDQSGDHFQDRPSAGAGQGSFQQQRDRCEIIAMLHSVWAFLSILKKIVLNAGHFLYVTVPEDGLKNDWASFQSHHLEPTNSSHPCKVSEPLN